MTKDIFSLENKLVLVVGGRGYLGRTLCKAIYRQGAKVIAADLPAVSKAAKAAQVENPTDKNIINMDVDVENESSVINLIQEIKNEYGNIDALVYSVTAKPDDFYKPYTECSLTGWQKVLRTELDGVFLLTREVGKVMEENESGSIILLSSIYGVVGNDQRIYQGSNLDQLYADSGSSQNQIYSHSVYSAVKGSAIALTRYLAAYWGEKNIRVNCISPGGISHPGENETFVKKYSDKVPLGRKADVNEMSGAVIYLLSEASSYVTGQNIIVDGGWTIW